MVLHNHTVAVGIVGVTGYSGVELLRILRRHPGVQVTELYARSSVGTTADALAPVAGGEPGATVRSVEEIPGTTADVLFFALPHAEGAKIIPHVPANTRIVDLSGDFRLRDAAAYPAHYAFEHPAPALLGQSVYGLTELNRPAIQEARLVANPGCYPTATVLPLAPLAAKGLLPATVAVHALSGVSGAGKSPKPTSHFVEVNESVSAYKVGSHQHTPEIEQALADAGAPGTQIVFIPHLIPVSRGMHVTMTIPLPNNYTGSDIDALFREFYASSPFVRILAQPPRMIDVAYTNLCDIYLHVDARTQTLSLLSVIDNLGKGAAGQAIQNMNIMTGQPETAGLA